MEKNITIIKDVIDYIETHLEEKLDLENLARQATRNTIYKRNGNKRTDCQQICSISFQG